MTSTHALSNTTVEEQADIARRIAEIMDAAQHKDLDRLESYHLYDQRFSKFDDFEPLERQDAEAARRFEREAITGVKTFEPAVSDLKVDVFGPVALTTFIFTCAVTTHDDEQLSLRARATMAFVRDGMEWKIVHEHFSPFKSNP
jgi:ketosteroid isomerase-like protein